MHNDIIVKLDISIIILSLPEVTDKLVEDQDLNVPLAITDCNSEVQLFSGPLPFHPDLNGSSPNLL
jgi:hypothetical protein